MYDKKCCVRCGIQYERPKNCRGRRWIERMYCSAPCQRLSAVESSNRERVITPEGRAKMAENARRNLHKETPGQRKARMENVIRSRVANGKWTPPALGKIGSLRIGVWKDEEASYNAKHRWIQNHWQKTGKCEDCGKKPRPFGKRKHGTEWANLADDYVRNERDGWKELCVPCHRTLDRLKRLEKGT